MSEVRLPASELSLTPHPGLFFHLWMDIRSTRLDSLPQHTLRTWAKLDAGYCLDAPTLIPAGGCRVFEVPGLELPEQSFIERDSVPEESTGK